MRIAICLAVWLVLLPACKKRTQATVPEPDSNPMAGGGNVELPGAVVFHTMRRYSGHTNQALAFYAAYWESVPKVR